MNGYYRPYYRPLKAFGVNAATTKAIAVSEALFRGKNIKKCGNH